MKFQILFVTIMIVLLAACQKQEAETETITQRSNEAANAVHQLPSLDNDYLVSIYEAQELIKIRQEDVDLRRSYCDKAYLPDHKIFVSMGIARLHHPETGAAIPEHMVEKAARMDAIRWAAYGNAWLTNSYEPSFGKISANFQQDTEVINKAHVGDSLFIFIATRMP